MKANTLRNAATLAEWRVVDTRGIVAVLIAPGDIVGWIATSETGRGVVATPRLAQSRWFLALDEAQAWLEAFLPDGPAVPESIQDFCAGVRAAFPEARPAAIVA